VFHARWEKQNSSVERPEDPGEGDGDCDDEAQEGPAFQVGPAVHIVAFESRAGRAEEPPDQARARHGCRAPERDVQARLEPGRAASRVAMALRMDSRTSVEMEIAGTRRPLTHPAPRSLTAVPPGMVWRSAL
jgi:hypothetical protein